MALAGEKTGGPGERQERTPKRRREPIRLVVEGEPDPERVLQVLEYLLYRRGPVARLMNASQRPR